MNVSEWIPDWRDEKSYPDPQKTTMRQWAWEFLRRNREYQEDYDSLMTVFDSLQTDCADKPTDKLDWHKCTPPALPGETISEWRKRVGHPNEILCPAEVFKDKYGITMPIDPAMEVPIYRFTWEKGVKFAAYDQRNEGLPYWKQPSLTPGPGQIAVLIDLNRPTEPQLKNLEYLLEGKHILFRNTQASLPDPTKKRKTKDHYREYLRVLDADLHLNAERHKIDILDEMAKILVPYKQNEYPNYNGRQTIRNWLNKAQRYRDGGYLHLACL